MNIGIDFDNTITEHPLLFKKLTRSLINGNKIYVISSCDRPKEPKRDEVYAEKEERLRGWGVHYSKLLLALEPIPRNKATLCRRYGIDIMIDDDRRNVKAIRKYSKATVCLEFVFEKGN